ncbi:sister-chromatid cohesion protein 3 [Tanacetum coccineum]
MEVFSARGNPLGGSVPNTLGHWKSLKEFYCEVIKRKGKQILQVVKFWVEQYEKDSKPAVVELSTMLFEDLYLKYLGWTLNGKSVGIRKASILALQDVYDVDDNVGGILQTS